MTSADDTELAFNIQGMDCASCVAHVEKAARKLPGVIDCQVNLARGRAVVRVDPLRVSAKQLTDAITSSGYPAEAEIASSYAGEHEEHRHAAQARHTRAWLVRAVVGAALWLPVELLHWTHHWLGLHGLPLDWIALLASSISLIFVGSAFYASAGRALLRRTTNMDTLIAMGATVAYVYSLVVFVGSRVGGWQQEPPLYFMEASGLLALISIGHYLEMRARESAGSAIRELLELAPAVAHRLTRDLSGNVEDVAVAELQVGDRVQIRPGERVPTDGVVTSGRSSVDESMITGEPLPVLRQPNDSLVGGTINQDGALQMRVTATGASTALAQIVRMVETAQSSKPPVQRLADQISGVFVPSVLAVALLTGIGWFAWGTAHHWPAATTWAALARAVCSVLIIACPCALGLAVPAALMVGIGRGAKHGILIRNIDSLENANRVKLVCFDKTGTITQGKPVVVDLRPVDGTDPAELLRLAASAEQFSEHPLARAIVRAAQSRSLGLSDPGEFSNQPGLGVRAVIGGSTLLVGGDALMAAHQVNTTQMVSQADEGSTFVFVALSSSGAFAPLGAIVISDQIKSDSGAAIADVHSMGLQTLLLTGDREASAQTVASAVGINEVFSGVKPGGKADAVRDLQRRVGRVAMVGDGINDAPALAQADLGIAIGSGSDIAKETGDIVLVSGSLSGVASAIRLSRATMRTIRQNLFLAFIYNVLAIPLAAFGLLTPLIAAAAMALSDVTVIGNALLLRRVDLGRGQNPGFRHTHRDVTSARELPTAAASPAGSAVDTLAR